jgi:hypothetical protein
MWKNLIEPGRQATDDNMAHAHCMPGNYGWKNTIGICHCIPLQQWLHERVAVLCLTLILLMWRKG